MERLVIKAIQPLIENALKKVGVPEEDIQWTEMRPDSVDITASWPKHNPTRNIHAWLTGRWPRLSLDVEGYFWEEDMENESRQTHPFSFPSDHPGEPAAIIALNGLASNPNITIIGINELSRGLNRLAADISGISGVYISELQPEPR